MISYAPAQTRKKVGHITPSSNSVLEPLTACMAEAVGAHVSHHFSRIKVEGISLDARYTDQFATGPMLAAAELLADAGVDVIMWNGTSGGWNGLDADRELCALIEARTGIPASTSTLAQLEAMEVHGLSDFGLVVPYTDEVTARITTVYGAAGYHAVRTANEGVSVNREMAFISEDRVRALARAADDPDAECILIVCTGLAAAHLVAELEAELGKPVIDSVAVVLWKAMRLIGVEPQLAGWGALLAGAPLGVASEPR
jgi:maleate isomerase